MTSTRIRPVAILCAFALVGPLLYIINSPSKNFADTGIAKSAQKVEDTQSYIHSNLDNDHIQDGKMDIGQLRQVPQDDPHQYINRDVTHDCKLPRARDRIFYSQSNEDWSLFNLYFGTPVICNGTFVELGAVDGVLYSNTKFYEDTLGWSGVLIEANPNNYERLRKKRPRSKKYHGAVCQEGKTNATMMFRKAYRAIAVGGDKSQMTDQYMKQYVPKDHEEATVPCRPLASYLHDAGIRHVDLFSLDVEGAEYLVLQTMDWQIPVHVFVIEMGYGHDEDIRALLREHGYFPSPYNIRNFCLPKRDCANNEVFVKPNFSYT